MDYKETSCKATAWQASLPNLMHNFADKWQEAANTSIIPCQQEPKKLTTEALCFLCVILVFVLLCLIGSSIRAYESFRKVFTKKEILQNLKEQRNERNRVTQVTTKKKEDEHLTISDWKGKCRKFFNCFSIQTNARQILSTDTDQEHMDCVDGIRILYFLCVFLAHFFLFAARALKNIDYKLQYIHELPLTPFAMHAAFGVDSFIALSGFLTAYSFSKNFEKNNGKISWFSFYIKRFLRITPVYMAVLGFYTTLFTYINSSPVWPTYDTNPVCRKNWIWNFLYINNFIAHHNQCMSMTWFLGCVMQLYVISPLFMIPLNRWPRIGYILSVVTIWGSCYATFITSKKHKIFATLPKNLNIDELSIRVWQMVDEMHQKTYVKLTPYIIGILLGYYLHRRKLSEKNSLLTLTFGWIIYAIQIWFCLFALENREESVWESAVYNGLKGLVFSCSFSWIVFVCATKQGGFINKLLSYPMLKPIARLSFCAFLIETIVLEVYFLSDDTFMEEIDMSKGLLFNLGWIPILAHLLMWTLVSAFVVSLLFEYPSIRLLHTYFLDKEKTS
ncbi:nose resistant to fluoxetine protein 6-like [Argiope bruennichi]|uniref:nose resistant to fluoxetine protein 6-like n=1 Tax=Argiope bruennichi TaxID=94029 RepID=UPI0024949A66|nr:nose resistant to fluoxetine protein 6-like [Argiope bruennichi]XP_055935066.1 nose resistant to fluoxetine protein 6-like [Argiope bruennichi]